MEKYFVHNTGTFSVFLDEEDSVWYLGTGLSTIASTPRRITELVNISVISAGFRHIICVGNNGSLWGLGENERGQLGLPLGSQCRQLVPKIIPGLPKMVHVDCGAYHTICLDESNRIWSFGSSTFGQLGRGHWEVADYKPKLIGIENVKKFACGGFHNIVLCGDGALYSFGRNDIGQLGLGGEADSAVPQLVRNNLQNLDIVSISCGFLQSILLTSTGELFGCGHNGERELFIEEPIRTNLFLLLDGIPKMRKIGSGYYSSFAIDVGGTLWISGSFSDDVNFRSHSFEGIGERICEVSKGGNHILFKGTSGRVWMCGSPFSQLRSSSRMKSHNICHPQLISDVYFFLMATNSENRNKSARK